jgi:hypothetical protein
MDLDDLTGNVGVRENIFGRFVSRLRLEDRRYRQVLFDHDRTRFATTRLLADRLDPHSGNYSGQDVGKLITTVKYFWCRSWSNETKKPLK